MSNINEHTGDKLISKPNTKAFEDNFDAIFRKDKPVKFKDIKQLATYMANNSLTLKEVKENK